MKLYKTAVCIAAAVSVMLCGCGKNSGENGSGNYKPDKKLLERMPAEKSEEFVPNDKKEIVPIPENGWTSETLNDVIYLKEQKTPIPFPVSELTDGLSADMKQYINFGDELYTNILYNGEYAMDCHITDTSDEAEIVLLAEWIGDSSSSGPFLWINGVTVGSSYDEAVVRLGFDAQQSKYLYDGAVYMLECVDDLIVTVEFDKDNIVERIEVMYCSAN